MPSSPPVRSYSQFSTEEFDAFMAEEIAGGDTLGDTLGDDISWGEFLTGTQGEEDKDGSKTGPPSVHFTAVNSTVDSAREFTARQILLNAEFSSPDTSEASPPRAPLAEIPCTSNVEGKKRGRPKGWRKTSNVSSPTKWIQPHTSPSTLLPKKKGRPKGSNKPAKPTAEEAWSERVRAGIKDVMLEHLAKGISPEGGGSNGRGDASDVCLLWGTPPRQLEVRHRGPKTRTFL
jgi:hypothetical protein